MGSVVMLWLQKNDLWFWNSGFDWSNVFGLTFATGVSYCVAVIVAERQRRKQAVKGEGNEESDLVEPVENGKPS
ncbi:hypothetical protein GCM10010466_36580 [Planomonospora alba]|uniref:Uncharacterized protein n=1 Tax=Planomonospora alba TaxID=161354 RepID=A0ABP6NBM6_9ACTN